MKVSICVVASLLLVFIGATMAVEEMMENNELAHKLVKRGIPVTPPTPSQCGNNGDSCRSNKCCIGYSCVYGSCKSCNPRKCKNTRDCCDDSSCVYGNCKSCTPRICKKTRDCCNGSSCVYGNCKSCQERTCTRSNDCCGGYTCSYKKCIRPKKE
ncbi:keratin-associated protein 10-4-like [Mytilus edulis]|uniref:keratin-associated protein 10-4-like n=1 Tax=Mytilus edulis TaxID=6550 RepID=UPI0039F04DED